MQLRKSVARFPDIWISGTDVEFGASKSALFSLSGYFKEILDQSPDLGSYKVDVPVKDAAIEAVLGKIHRQDQEIKNDKILECLHLALKWNIVSLKNYLLPKAIKLVNPENGLKVMEIGRNFGCTELVKACANVTPKEGSISALTLMPLQTTMAELGKKTSERLTAIETKMANIEEEIKKHVKRNKS